MKIQTITFNIPVEAPTLPDGFTLHSYRVDRTDYEVRGLYNAGHDWAHQGINDSALIARAEKYNLDAEGNNWQTPIYCTWNHDRCEWSIWLNENNNEPLN